jgi:hypothetical protein
LGKTVDVNLVEAELSEGKNTRMYSLKYFFPFLVKHVVEKKTAWKLSDYLFSFAGLT